MRRTHPTLLLVLLASACDVTLGLPSPPVAPPAVEVPVITDFAPRVSFAGEYVEVEGTGFDPVSQNNTVIFAGGELAQAEEGSTSTRLLVLVPQQAGTGKLSVSNNVATSAQSEHDFYPLGYGHPALGTGVAELRFRHRPVGIVNMLARILAASTLFDAVLDDSGRFKWVPGRPTALVRLPEEHAFLALRDDGGGSVMEIEATSNTVVATSAPSPRYEQFVVPAATPGAVIARSFGFDANGRPFLTRWKKQGEALAPESTPAPVELAEVLGATSRGEELWVVGTRFIDDLPVRVLARVLPDGTAAVRWRETEDEDGIALPAGPIAIVDLPAPAGDLPAGPAAVLGLADGDLATIPLAGGPWRRTRLISFAAAHSIVPHVVPGHVLVSKPRDGAIFDYDLGTEDGDFVWSAQLRGEPTVIDVTPELDEIAVANAEDNDVDVLSLVDGRWLGRSSLSLGLGSADGGPGGVVRPYSYDPRDYPEGGYTVEGGWEAVMYVLARTAPLVIVLDAGELGMKRQYALDPDVSEPLRLAVTPDLRTLVIHRSELGQVVPRTPGSDATTDEKIVARDLPAQPTDVAFLRDGRVLVATAASVEVYEWREALLVRTGRLRVPSSAFVTGLVSHRARIPGSDVFGDGGKDVVLVMWKLATGAGGALFDPAAIQGDLSIGTDVRLPPGAADQTGVADLVDGPGVVFAHALDPEGDAFGPALLRAGYLRGDEGSTLVHGMTGAPTLLGATPDGRFAMWVTEGSGEHVVRVIQYYPDYSNEGGFSPWNGYRLPAAPAGPDTDPSGQWLYIPVPKLDLLSVVQ